METESRPIREPATDRGSSAPRGAPPVVVLMVVSDPGDWFDETLAALAAQDYPNIRYVFFVADGDFDAIGSRINAVLTNAFVRPAVNPNSFGASINEVLRLIDGGNGLFLVCHDDVAPRPNAVRILVTELFRSQAGIVGPKLVDWDNDRVLQHVGLGIDRLGEIDPLIEPGEIDQEQHDAVRDVFVIPSAFMLVRANLFRDLDGFDPAISFYGEDVDLCWRAHHAGARVVVAPDARVRHRERLPERRPGLNVVALQSRHRMRAVATLTGGSRLLIRSIQMVLVTIAEVVVGLFTGRLGEAIQSLRALFGLIPRTGSLLARRRAIAAKRVVPESEVLGLQVRGSSRLNSFLRGRETATYVGEDTTVRRWRQVGYGPLLTWVVLIGFLVIGSRKFFADGVPPTGEFLRFPSAGEMFSKFRSSFDDRGLGATSAVPTSWLLSSVLSVVTFFRMGMFATLGVVGSAMVGAMGAWRLGSIFPTSRARIATTIVYAGTPLVPAAFGIGQLSVLIWFAGLPWVVHQFLQIAGMRPADPEITNPGLMDGVVRITTVQRIKAGVIGAVLSGVIIAFVPAAALLILIVGLTLAAATLFARARTDVAVWIAVGAVAATVGGLALNVPWVFSWSWTDLVGIDAGPTGRSLTDVASMRSDSVRFGILALGLYAPVFVGVLLTSAWRFSWSVRGMSLVFGFGSALILKEFGIAGGLLPASGLLMVPLVLGLALSGGALVSGLDIDVLAKGFGWRQPVAVLANAAMLVGIVPAVLAIGPGNWRADSTPASVLFASQFVPSAEVGDYRVLYVGAPTLLPVAGREFEEGIGYAVVGPGEMTFLDRTVAPGTSGDDLIREALAQIGTGSTARGGRLLAPLGIRYLVIPKSLGVESVVREQTELTISLTGALSRQLDIGSVSSPPTMTVFENQSFIPVGADLVGATAIASTKSGVGALVRADFGSATPVLEGVGSDLAVSGAVAPEVVHLAIPFDERIGLEVGGAAVPARTGFGVTTAFDVSTAGQATVTYNAGIGRAFWILTMGVLWLLALGVIFAPRSRLAAIRRPDTVDETLIDLAGDTRLEDLDRFDEVLSDGERYDGPDDARYDDDDGYDDDGYDDDGYDDDGYGDDGYDDYGDDGYGDDGYDDDGGDGYGDGGNDPTVFDPGLTGEIRRQDPAVFDPGLTGEIRRQDPTRQINQAFDDEVDDDGGWL